MPTVGLLRAGSGFLQPQANLNERSMLVEGAPEAGARFQEGPKDPREGARLGSGESAQWTGNLTRKANPDTCGKNRFPSASPKDKILCFKCGERRAEVPPNPDLGVFLGQIRLEFLRDLGPANGGGGRADGVGEG